MNDSATPLRHWQHPVTIGGDIVIAFRTDVAGSGWWDPDERVILIDASQPAVEVVTTLLHEVGHALCGDAADNMSARDHEAHQDWARSAADLLALVRRRSLDT